MPGGKRSSSRDIRAERRGRSITSTTPAPPHGQTLLWKYLIPDHNKKCAQHQVPWRSSRPTTCHFPQYHQKEEVNIRRDGSNLTNSPEGIGTVGISNALWGWNIFHQWTPQVHHKRTPHIAWGHQESVEAHLKSPKLHGNFHGAAQGVWKLNLCAFCWI